MQYNIAYWKDQTKKHVIVDMKNWATFNNYNNRKGCYGPDRSHWPY
jgi:hypothetical protein